MKSLKFIIAAFVTTLPMSAYAMCDWGEHDASATAAVCAAGQVFDQAKQECVDTVG